MSKSLYEEAIEAAEQIKFSAEEKVKQKLVESMSPQIKKMIEKSFLLESNDEEESVDSDNDLVHDDKDDSSNAEASSDTEEEKEGSSNNECNEDNEEQFFFGISDNHNKKSSDILVDTNNEGISENTKRILSKLITKSNRKINLENRVLNLKENTKRLKKALILSESNKKNTTLDKRFLLIYKNLLKEAKNIELNSIIKSDNILLKEFLEITKELKNMSRRRRTRGGFLNESLEDLLETNLFEEDGDEEEQEEDGEDVELSDDDASDDPLDNLDLDDDDDEAQGAEADDLSNLVRKFIDDAEDVLGSEGEEEFELPDMSDEEDEEVQEEGMFYETEHDDDQENEGQVIEIDENMLRKEIARMRRIREGEAKDMASHFGGGSLGKEMFVDVDDGDLNVHADHLGREDVPTPKVEAALRKAARTNRMLESKNQQYKKALRAMKGQLSEMNLFNAKLLYANKLMQNRDLSIKQQRHIVESLDEAKTLGEAKILFESLSKSLVKGTTSRSGNSMNESVTRNAVGSSSRPMSSAQPLNEGVALDRWATLAGIRK